MTLVQTYFKTPVKKLSTKDRKEIRRQVYVRDGGLCQVCGDPVPLYDYYGDFDVFTCGHAAHIKSEGAGGKYEVNNLILKCPKCHLGLEHGPRWSANATNK
jgi:5-methylcytosine-specific restriction endonuclease McrA